MSYDEPEDEPLITSAAIDYVWRTLSRLESDVFWSLCIKAGRGGRVTEEMAQEFLQEHLRFKGNPFR
jgi:hypothetical protein